MTIALDRALIGKIPKTDLHLHLDGSLRLSTLIELAREEGRTLPSWTEEGLMETVFREEYASLEDYLKGFDLTCSVLLNPDQIERVACELAQDNQAEGVRYIEVRFAPQLHARPGFDLVDVMRAASRGLDRAKAGFNRRPEVASGAEPPFEYGLIACAMRSFHERLSEYYRSFMAVHRFTETRRARGLASLELAQAAARARDEGIPVVGLDLAGAEKGSPPIDHREAYDCAHRCFLKKTVHAGEDYGPESIFQAITELHADRIGHGTSLFNPLAIRNPSIEDRERYVRSLAQFIADRRITVEVCLTSNQQTNPALRDLKDHPFRQMLKHKLSVTLCTDNRTVSRTTVTDEIWKAVKAMDMTIGDLKNVIVYGFKRSFFPGEYARKREYVRQCMEYFESIVGGGKPEGR